MNSEAGPARKWLPFPTIVGVFAGLIPGVSAVFTDVSQPFWVAVKVILLVLAFGFAAANLIGLAVGTYRRSRRTDTESR
jgi:hypothetical protein